MDNFTELIDQDEDLVKLFGGEDTIHNPIVDFLKEELVSQLFTLVEIALL